jgi:ribosomal protein S15P/S13E
LRCTIDEELNEVLNRENEKQGGLIWETHAKLTEMGEDKRRAEVCISETQVYLIELDIVAADWEGKTREDIAHLEERIERMRRHLAEVEVALARHEVKDMISLNMRKAKEPHGGEAAISDERPPPNVEEIDLELVRS